MIQMPKPFKIWAVLFTQSGLGYLTSPPPPKIYRFGIEAPIGNLCFELGEASVSSRMAHVSVFSWRLALLRRRDDHHRVDGTLWLVVLRQFVGQPRKIEDADFSWQSVKALCYPSDVLPTLFVRSKISVPIDIPSG